MFIYPQYLSELGCPYTLNDKPATVDWLLGYAVRLEYGDDGELVNNYEKVIKQSYLFLFL